MPNALAYGMLLIWPLVAAGLFQRLPVERAFVWTILGGYLILPPATAIDLPLLPPLDKHTVPNLSAFVFCLLIAKRPIALMPRSWLGRGLVLAFVLGGIPTVLTNGEPRVIAPLIQVSPTAAGPAVLPGLGVRDILSIMISQILVLLPFLMGRSLLASDRGRRELLVGLVGAGLVYTLPSLVEIRLSPQLNIWVYGFFQHDFQQMIRGGGFRPIVFLPHALWLAFFLVCAAIAAAGLARFDAGKARKRYLLAALYLVGVIVLCKSLAALLYALLLVPLVLMTGEKARLRLAAIPVVLALMYPMLRTYEIVPLDRLVGAAEAISEDRAQSLDYRFDNEEMLLDRARQKPWFGWGAWGRNLLYDPRTARDETIADSRWIIVFGERGLSGFLAEFGLLGLPILLLWLRSRRLPPDRGGRGAGTLAIILGITMVDMLINAPLVPYVWMIAGALLGHAEAEGPERQGSASEDPPEPERRRVLIGERPGSEAGSQGPRTVLSVSGPGQGSWRRRWRLPLQPILDV